MTLIFCGNSVWAEPCSKCGKILDDDAKYCSECGSKIEAKTTGKLGNQIVINNITLIKCPAGSFTVGSPVGEIGRDNSFETQQHITFEKDFYIGKYPITQEQYKAIMGNNPSKFSGATNPVEQVSWFDAVKFCEKLNELTVSSRPAGFKFTLPAEAYWEYACRAGTTTSLNSGKNITTDLGSCPNIDEVAWYRGNSGKKTHPVGLKKPNNWGIYDMHGNVYEWCLDQNPYDSHKSIRGGSFFMDPDACRSAATCYFAPEVTEVHVGFRVALFPFE